VKIRDVRPAEAEVVRARHILIRSESDNAEIETELNEIKNQIAAGNLTFAEAARAHSQDGSASQGGDLGWFGRGQMVDVFDDAAFEAPLNEVVGPIKSRFGYHLIEVQDRASSEVKISDLALQIRTDIATLNNIQEQLEDLRYFSDETGDFEEEAERLGLNVQTVQITPDQQMIPGLGSSRTILNFLESAAEGELSPVIELDDVFVVGEVEEIIPEGYRPFDDVRSEVQPRVYIEKKKELLSERIDTALENNDFDALPQVLGTQKQTAENVTFSMNVVPGLGREPRFTGTALGIDEGETSGVVAGENAVFVVKAISVDEPAPITEAQRAQLRNQMLQQRRTEVRSQWLAQLRERAAIEDHRSRFLQQ
jgi:peptidylprolyl isomerase/peptidyl-prolyl cis-trans isomerase D